MGQSEQVRDESSRPWRLIAAVAFLVGALMNRFGWVFAGHASADTTRIYDDRRGQLSRSPVYLLASHLTLGVART